MDRLQSIGWLMALGLDEARALELLRGLEDAAWRRQAYRRSGDRTGLKLSLPLRLRDARRIMSGAGHPLAGRLWPWLAIVMGRPGWSWSGGLARAEMCRLIDRSISRHGPDHDLWPAISEAMRALGIEKARDVLNVDAVERPQAERTDHVTDSDALSDGAHDTADANAHGGDGNSGEMDHRAETAADERDGSGAESAQSDDAAGQAGAKNEEGQHGQMSLPDQPSTGSEAADDSPQCGGAQQAAPVDADDREALGQPSAGGQHGDDEPTREMGAHHGSRTGAADDKSDADAASCPAVGGEMDADVDTCDASGEDDEDGDAGAPAESQGAGRDGGTTQFSRAERYMAAQRRAAREVSQHLRRIVEQACTPGGDASHRFDAARLVRELVSRRYRLDAARRREREIRELVIAVDDSNSCAETVEATYAAAMAAAKVLPEGRVSVLLHRNGYLLRLGDICAPWLRRLLRANERALQRHYYSASQRDASMDIWQAIAGQGVGLLINLGDRDAIDALDTVTEAGAQVLCLSHHHYQAAHDVLAPVVDAVSAAKALGKHK